MNVEAKIKEALKTLDNYTISAIEEDHFYSSIYTVDSIEELYKQHGWKYVSDSMDRIYNLHKLYRVYGKNELAKFYYELVQILIEWSADNLTLKDVKKFNKYLISNK